MVSIVVSFFSAASLEVYKDYTREDKCCTIHMEDLSIQVRSFEELIKLEDALVEVRNYLSAYGATPDNVQRDLPLVIKVGTDSTEVTS